MFNRPCAFINFFRVGRWFFFEIKQKSGCSKPAKKIEHYNSLNFQFLVLLNSISISGSRSFAPENELIVYLIT